MITGKKVVLHNKRLTHARNEYSWHTDAELTTLDAAPKLTISFPRYFMDYAMELRLTNSASRSFAIETPEGKHIGKIGYYDIDEVNGEAELGIMIGDRDYWGKGYGSDAVTTLIDYIFRKTNLKRIHLKSLEWNIRAHRCFQGCGFTICGRQVSDVYSFILMEITHRQWEQRQKNTEGASRG